MKAPQKTIIFLFLAVPIVWVVACFSLNFFIEEAEARGQFGDMFGAVNALFSGWAFVGVIVAILLQKEELELQRQELAETRKEFKDQNETLKKQRFENTFFNMISLHSENVSSFELSKNNKEYKGKDVFKSIYGRDFKNLWNRAKENNGNSETVEKIYSQIYCSYDHILGHYFRSLYRIIKFVDLSDIEENEKAQYVKILRAQLSNFELFLLFYNCAYYEEGRKFKGYVEKYALLNNIPKNNIFDHEHLNQYSSEAYGGYYVSPDKDSKQANSNFKIA